ncbi:hypothetical protein BC940DRAFT_302739 [Gongronella butleri]|nr:hypothetical protein BC940DRAFT_302739 [Gongronella butleri]
MHLSTLAVLSASLAVLVQGQAVTDSSATYKPTGTAVAWKNTYPSPGAVPKPKPEWVKLINNSTVPPAPISVKGPDGSLVPPAAGGNDTYCHWSFSQCLRPTDVATCQKGNWALTYDDGPSNFSLPLYDYLKQNNIKATFFVIGGQVIQFPDLLKRLHDDGHEIGIHTWSHQLLTSQSTEEIIAELKWTELAIQEVLGVTPRFMRPPYGDMDDRVREIVKQLGFIPVIWNYDTFDWKLASNAIDKATVQATIKQWVDAAPQATIGGISLEHDITAPGVEIAIAAAPQLKQAYNLTLTSQCANMSTQETWKEYANNNNSNNGGSGANGSSSNKTSAAAGLLSPQKGAIVFALAAMLLF